MATAAPIHVSLEHHLRTSYLPEFSFREREFEERNRGEDTHAKLQRLSSTLAGTPILLPLANLFARLG